MRIKQDGKRYQQDLSIQHQATPIYWRGTQTQTLAFYRRLVATFLADAQWRKAHYERHFDADVLARAMAAVDELQAHLESMREQVS